MTEHDRRPPLPIRRETPGIGPLVPPKRPVARATVVLAVALLLMLPFRSASLDDFDSYSFALALDNFDVQLQQPQPPGFPVYVALAKVIYALRPDPVTALTLLSALCGVASVWLVYRIGRLLDPQMPLTALAGALVFAVVPVVWLTSGKALTDMPGLAWVLLSLWLWLDWWRRGDRRPPYLAAAVTGLALGVRPQNALPVAMLIAAYVLQDTLRRRTLRPWVKAAGIGLVAVLVWLIPTAAMSGGLPSYLALLSVHARHVGRADALLGMSEPLHQGLRIRLFAFADTGLTSLLGSGLTSQEPGTTWRTVVWALAMGLGILRAGWRRRQTWWLACWWFAVTLQLFLFETLDRPRLFLPLLPPLLLLAAAGWSRWLRRRWLVPIVISLGFLAVLLQTLPLVTTLSRVPAPPAQATDYVAAHYPADRTLVAAAGSFRAAQVELPDYPLVYLYTFDPEAVSAAMGSDPGYVAVLDRDQFTPSAMVTLSRDGELVTVEDRLFTRDRNVHTQHDQVRLQVLAPSALVPPGALRLRPDGCLDLGGGDDGRYLGPGWFRAEDVGGTTARWAGGEPTATLRLLLPAHAGQKLRFRALAHPQDQTVTVNLSGQRLGNVPLDDTWSVVELAVPDDLLGEETVVVITLTHDRIQSPFNATAGASSDRRELAAAYDWLCVVSSGPESGGD